LTYNTKQQLKIKLTIDEENNRIFIKRDQLIKVYLRTVLFELEETISTTADCVTVINRKQKHNSKVGKDTSMSSHLLLHKIQTC